MLLCEELVEPNQRFIGRFLRRIMYEREPYRFRDLKTFPKTTKIRH